MRQFARIGMLAMGLAAFGLVGDGFAQSKKATKNFRGRLPNGWTRIGLSDEQEAKIKDIQIKNYEKIAKLEAELAALRDEQMKAMKKVLTPDQLKMVEQMEEEAKAKKKSTGSTKEARKSEEKPSEPESTGKAKKATKKKSADGG